MCSQEPCYLREGIPRGNRWAKELLQGHHRPLGLSEVDLAGSMGEENSREARSA